MKFDIWDYIGLGIFLAVIAGYWAHWFVERWRRVKKLIEPKKFKFIEMQSYSLPESAQEFMKEVEQIKSQVEAEMGIPPESMTFKSLQKMKALIEGGAIKIPSPKPEPFTHAATSDMADAVKYAMSSASYDTMPRLHDDQLAQNIDDFDAYTSQHGYRLNLITGKYYKP